MDLKKYNNLITSGRWCTKDPKDAQILTPVVLDQKLVDDSKKTSDKSNRESTKLEPAYIRDLPPLIMEETKGGVGHNTNNGK